MAEAHAKHHDYHLVNPSPWPVVGSIFVFADGGRAHHLDALDGRRRGAVRPARPDGVPVGAAGILFVMFMWWRDVIREAHGGDHTPVVQLHLRYGMIMFIASEVMFFVAWFWAYFDVALFPAAVHPARGHRSRRHDGRRPSR